MKTSLSHTIGIWAATGLLCGTIGVAFAEKPDDDDKEGEADVDVPLREAPALVQATLRKRLGAKTPGTLEVEKKKGVQFWEAEFKQDGAKQSLKLDAIGTIVELEKEVTISSIPEKVRRAVVGRYPNAKIKSAEEVHINDTKEVTFFEIEVKDADRTVELKVQPNGVVVD